MSSERKTIKINPDLFKIDSSTTRKNKKPANPKEIRVKSNVRNNKTLKRSLLKFIRNRQEDGLNNILPKETHTNETDNFQSDFKESLDYLTKIAKENKQKIKTDTSSSHNHTLKRYDTQINRPPVTINGSMTPIVIPKPETNIPSVIIKPVPPPLYGCLKGGQLPTYRTYVSQMNQQQQHQQQQHQQQQHPIINISSQNPQQPTSRTPGPVAMSTPKVDTEPPQQNTVSNLDLSTIPYNAKNIIRENDIKRAYHLAGTHMKGGNKKKKHSFPKQKRTLRRTFYIGKSKVFPKISVLVSNKTIRNNIANKSTQIKQTPLTEVKRYLIKKGFIKVGSIAPPDVLRKMYESALLMCGEIQNHNPDNLLYNYLNANDENQ